MFFSTEKHRVFHRCMICCYSSVSVSIAICIVKSVMFGISNLIFHCKYPFLKFVFVWHQLTRIFTWAVLGRDANNSKSASHITEHKKKSEPFAYRLWVRISTVWCGQEDLNLHRVAPTRT